MDNAALIDAMVIHCIATALWSSSGDDDEFLDAHYDRDDLAEATLKMFEEDCAKFFEANKADILCEDAPLAKDFEGPIAERKVAMAGHDFWLTRCGHGAGFWDGDWPDEVGKRLTDASKGFGNVDLYVGDDGLIYAG